MPRRRVISSVGPRPQPAQLIDALSERWPGDLRAASKVVTGNGKRWREALARGLDLLAKHDPRVRGLVEARRVR